MQFCERHCFAFCFFPIVTLLLPRPRKTLTLHCCPAASSLHNEATTFLASVGVKHGPKVKWDESCDQQHQNVWQRLSTLHDCSFQLVKQKLQFVVWLWPTSRESYYVILKGFSFRSRIFHWRRRKKHPTPYRAKNNTKTDYQK